MSHSFVAYIDESGCEGGLHGQGGSEWFVLTAIVCRVENDNAVCEAIEEICELHQKDTLWKFKFSTLRPKGKILAARTLASKPVRVATIIVHKPSAPIRPGKDYHTRLYFYCGKFLLERISWICRDHAHLSETGDGATQIVFSKRKGFPYDRFKSYVQDLRDKPWKHNTRIDWSHIDPGKIEAKWHHNSRGCKLADIAAGTFFLASEYTAYDITDDRPIRHMRGIVYSPAHTTVLNSGIKFWPPEAMAIVTKEGRFDWLRNYF